jgi:tetratricopeptide (TPR) repeat protein
MTYRLYRRGRVLASAAVVPRALLILLGLSLAAGAPLAARGQVAAPSLIEEDLPPAEEPRREAEPKPASAVAEPEPEPVRPVPRTPAPPPAPPPVRAIEPVRASFDDLLAVWQARRAALREQDLPRARDAERRLLELRRELGIENLEAHATAEVRASGRALSARVPAEAVARAELAVALAPDDAAAHFALAHALAVRDPGHPGPAARALAAGLSAAAREPHTARAFVADLCAAGLAAALATSVLVLALLFLRRLGLVLHDVRHLPVLRATTPLQAAFVALVVLAAPLALRLGPAALLVTIALCAAPYLRGTERAVASAALLALAALPSAAGEAARLTAFTGTLADDVYALEHGADDGRIAARLAARAARGELPAAGLLALGHHHKRRGDLADALRWYQAAGSGRPEGLVGVGNVQLLRGDLDAAKGSYLAAVDRASAAGDLSSLAAAHYDLSKVFVRQSALDQAQEARRKAAAEDGPLVARAGSDEDFRQNRWLIDAPVPLAEVRALAADDAPRGVSDAIRGRLAGPLPAAGWPWLLVAAALAPWPLAWLGRRRVSHRCERCGRAVCRRCDGVDGSLCGQCVNVYVKKDLVDPRDRLRKEQQVRRHARARRLATRAMGLLAGGAGHVWRGEAARGALLLLLLLFLAALALSGGGVAPPPQPAPWAAAAKLALVGPLAGAVWWLSIRDLFRRTRG